MKTLSEIIEAVKANERPDYEELRYALLAVSFLHFMDHTEVRKRAARADATTFDKLNFSESFNRSKRAMAADPKTYVGWNNDPENPAYQARVKLANKLVEKAIAGDLPNQHTYESNREHPESHRCRRCGVPMHEHLKYQQTGK